MDGGMLLCRIIHKIQIQDIVAEFGDTHELVWPSYAVVQNEPGCEEKSEVEK
jgi:hypothetical protein